MSRPLWQILFTMTFVAFAVQRVVVGYVLREGDVHPLLAIVWALVLLAGAAAFVGAWIERPWPVAGLVGAVGALLVAATLLQGFWLATLPAGAAASEALVIVFVSTALVLALRHGGGDERGARS